MGGLACRCSLEIVPTLFRPRRIRLRRAEEIDQRCLAREAEELVRIRVGPVERTIGRDEFAGGDADRIVIVKGALPLHRVWPANIPHAPTAAGLRIDDAWVLHSVLHRGCGVGVNVLRRCGSRAGILRQSGRAEPGADDRGQRQRRCAPTPPRPAQCHLEDAILRFDDAEVWT